MKSILFVLPSLSIGGLERVQVTIANNLARNGYNVTILTLDKGDELLAQLDPRVRFIHKLYKPHPVMKRIPYIRHKLYDDGMWETRASAKRLHDYYVGLERYDVEIAFFRGLSVKTISGGVKKSAQRFQQNRCAPKNNTDFREIVVHNEQPQTKHIAWVHTDFRRAKGYANQFLNMKGVFNAYQSFDHVVCVSKEAKQGFIETIGDTGNLTTIYNMLPVEDIIRKGTEQPTVKVHKAKFHMVIVARLLDSAKGQKRLIEAVSKLHDEVYDLSLAIVGGGSDEQMLKDIISERNAGGYITMVGSQLNPYPYIKEADLLVCSSYFEGYNLTVAEALILGTAVLSTDCTGPREILDNGKYGVIVENSESGLYEGIKRFCVSPELLHEYRQKAVERKEFFDEDRILKQITNLFGEEHK